MTFQIKSFDEYKAAYKHSVEDPEGFWAEQASTFQWRKKWDKVLEWDFKGPDVKWFVGGKLNITENCLDRHLETRGDQTAIIFEPNDAEQPAREISYKELHAEVCKVANALKANGVEKGDRICFLHANGTRTGNRRIGVCSYWCCAFSSICRIFCSGIGRPYQRCQLQNGDLL